MGIKNNLLVVILLLSSARLFAAQESVWLYGGVQGGYSFLDTDVAGEGEDKSGYQIGLQGSALWNFEKYALNATLSWHELSYESDYVNNTKYRLESRTFGLEISPLWKPAENWYVGPKFQYILGEELLVGPSESENVDNHLTTDKVIGLNAFYEMPWEDYNIRAGVHLHHLLDIGSRNSNVILFSLEIGDMFFKTAEVNAPVSNSNQEKVRPSSGYEKNILLETGKDEGLIDEFTN